MKLKIVTITQLDGEASTLFSEAEFSENAAG
jgi:hypothetical protein